MMKKLNVDCYYFYHSKCMKGDACQYRHAEAALGNEQICPEWMRGACNNYQCPLRHMKARSPPSQTRCHWETTPNGCLKSNCPFMHLGPKGAAGQQNSQAQSSNSTNNPNLHPIVVSLVESESEDEHDDVPSSKQTNGIPGSSNNRNVLTTVAQGVPNRRVVLPSKSPTKSQESTHFDTGIQSIGVLSGGRVQRHTQCPGNDLRRVLAGSQQAPAQKVPISSRLGEKPPGSNGEDQERRQCRMKRFSAEEEGILAKQPKKDEEKSRDSGVSSDKPENESLTSANTNPQNSLLLDEDELLGDVSAGNLEHDFISSV